MLRFLSLLTVVSLALSLCSSQESYAKSTAKKTKKAAAMSNLKAVKAEKKFSELDSNKTDRGVQDLHISTVASRALRSH